MSRSGPSRVLVVDDDPRNVRLLEGIFRTAGYEVDKAFAGAEALHRVRAAEPDLILLDVMMPGMSGHEVCRLLKEDPATRAIPVVLVTSLSSTEDKVEGLDLGADDFVPKPVNRLELLAKARSLLRIKALHDEVARAKKDLERTNGELLALERLKESLTQMIVHDLKNPLTAIMGNLHLLLQWRDDPSAVQKRAELALDSSKAMMRMILNLLDISRMEENKMTLCAERIEIASLLRAAIRESAGVIESAGVCVGADTLEGLPLVRGDSSLLARIVGNLLSNAIKHTPEGGRITVGARAEAGEMVVYVSDTGEGIPEESLGVIFEKFRQADGKRLGVRTDHGLGLTFCKMAVEAHGGRIWVESSLGRGSTFYVALPLEGIAAAAPLAAAAPSVDEPTPVG